MIEWYALGPHFLSYFQDNRMRRRWKHFKHVLIRDTFSDISPLMLKSALWIDEHIIVYSCVKCLSPISHLVGTLTESLRVCEHFFFFWGGGGVIKESSELCRICRGRLSGNRTARSGGFGSIQLISCKWGGFVSNCTALVWMCESKYKYMHRSPAAN